jgi:hypothetical protein
LQKSYFLGSVAELFAQPSNWKTDINQLTGQPNKIAIRMQSIYFSNIYKYINFIFKENKLSTEDNLLSGDDDCKPYLVFLNKIQAQLAS